MTARKPKTKAAACDCLVCGKTLNMSGLCGQCLKKLLGPWPSRSHLAVWVAKKARAAERRRCVAAVRETGQGGDVSTFGVRDRESIVAVIKRGTR